jgi:hypothetical protein
MFVCNYGSYDVGADVSFDGECLGKWLIACEPQAWHHIACDSLFRFHESYGTSRGPLPTQIPLSAERQIVSQKFSNQRQSRSDFNTYAKSKKDRHRLVCSLSSSASYIPRMALVM